MCREQEVSRSRRWPDAARSTSASRPRQCSPFSYALQALSEVPYTVWREFDPEDAMRFYALRLHEVGMLTSSPNALVAEGTDWRFCHDFERELMA